MSIWKDVKQGKFSDPNKKSNNVWASLESSALEEPVTIANYAPVVVNNILPQGSVAFDIETGSVDVMFSSGPEFLRLFGYSLDDEDVWTTTNVDEILGTIKYHNGWVIGHNIMNFDNLLLDKNHGLSILALAKAERLRDTKLIAFLADPPYSRTKEGEIERQYSLQNVGTKYLGEGKMVDVATGSSVLKRLAAEFGGYDMIPLDHPEYNEYLRIDVERTRDLVRVLPINDYVIREHKVAAVCATISIQGFRVDTDLLDVRIQEGEDKRARILTDLESYGLPSKESTKAPQRTKLGIAAIVTAFSDLGIQLPISDKGNPMMGKPVLEEIVENNEGEAADLAEAIMGLNGIRTIYGNIYDNLVGDRVHPQINLRQSTGRLSIQNPGLTVIGKRGGKVIERAVFLPDNEDHVLISADLSQVDARAVAGLSQDTEYLKLFEPGKDAHSEMALELYGTVDAREKVKACVHGVNYGMRSKKLAWTTGLPLNEAEDFIWNYERKFPRLARWQGDMREIGETVGILYNGFGRMMRIEPERAFTQSPALMGQSTARDILMEGVLNLWNNGGESVIKMIRGVIHDELVLSVHKDDLDEIEKLVVDSLSFEWCPVGGTYPVQILAGLNKRGANWAGCYCKGCSNCGG